MEAIAAALYNVGLPRLARRVLSKFHWGLHFLELNDELLNAYATCADGAEVVATQHRILSRWQEEEAQGIGRREMPPSDESSESGSSDEEPDERKGEPVEAGETPADAAVKASKSSESGPAEATAAMECGPCEDAEIGAPVSGGQEELADVTDALEATILNAQARPQMSSSRQYQVTRIAAKLLHKQTLRATRVLAHRLSSARWWRVMRSRSAWWRSATLVAPKGTASTL